MPEPGVGIRRPGFGVSLTPLGNPPSTPAVVTGILMGMFRRTLFSAVALVLLAIPAAAQDIDALGPQVGQQVPAFAGVDQFGRTQTLQSVLGPEGAMIVFFRSADW